MRTKPRKKTNKPDPQAVGSVLDRYYTWLWARDQKLAKARRVHWVGKRPGTN